MKRRSVFAAVMGIFCCVAGAQAAPVPGGTLDPAMVPKFVEPLPVPGAMPKAGTLADGTDFYAIAARQFKQQILPAGFPQTTVWGYGAVGDNNSFGYPARTIEARAGKPVSIRWVNDLTDAAGNFLPHLVPIDQTLHWANPPKECLDGDARTDCRGSSNAPYAGPVPLVTHVHGAHVAAHSDGYPEAWYLPNAGNIPAGYAGKGSHYSQAPGAAPAAGQAVYLYPNDQRAATLWYHDHTLGITRANVYAGLAGFYLLRDPATDPAALPAGPYEIPLAIQDRSFNADGSLFFPGNRAFFEGVDTTQLQIPFIPAQASGGMSDVSPIWNPEFFGNVMVVNGKAWPKLAAEPRRYRLRLLNGNDTRVLVLKIVKGDPAARPGTPAVPFWQIGADGGYLPKPVQLSEILLAPGERADVIVDLTGFVPGSELYLINEGPDQPFGGGRAPKAFAYADTGTTGQVMKIVVGAKVGEDATTPPDRLALPAREPLGAPTATRTVSLNEAESATVPVVINPDGSIVYSPAGRKAAPFAPVEAMLGSAMVSDKGVITPMPMAWMDAITENPGFGVETWEIYDFTADAHPIHLHQVQFEVLNRQEIKIKPDGTAKLIGRPVAPEPGEVGTKDTVLVYPGMVTRVKARFDLPGLYVWHCHILSHEDNEMMRPLCVGPMAGCN